MKRFIFHIALFIPFLNISSQEPTLTKNDIVGRWIEIKKMDPSEEPKDTEYPHTYIFRDNNTFHLGESSEGIILFNITGKYTIRNDTIDIVYYDFLQSKRNQKKLLLEKIALKDSIMTLLVSDYDYSYTLILRKQN